MATKIILSLSKLNKKPDGKVNSYCYLTPNKAKYQGVQTNEAPVKYFLSQDSAISQILCLVTPTVKDKENGAMEYFRQAVHKINPLVQILEIDIPDDGRISDKTMAALLQHVNKGDQVYLDTSGGARYTVMGLIQLVRLLEYKGVKLKKAVYANLSSKPLPTLDDVTELYQSQNLISGMQELTTFGSVHILKTYFFGNTTEDGKTIQKLLNAIGNMTDAITLCRLETLERTMTVYQTEMAAAASIKNPIMRELVDFFRNKFGTKITVPWVVLWCLEHRMLLQALTIYREWMPKYLLRESGLFTAVPDKLDERFAGAQKKYRDDNVALWEQFIHLAQTENINLQDNIYVMISTLENLNRYLPNSGFKVADCRKVTQVAWDMVYAKTLRNMVLHGNEDAKVDPRLEQALENQGYFAKFKDLTASDCIRSLSRAIKRIHQG